jgi:regulatory protein
VRLKGTAVEVAYQVLAPLKADRLQLAKAVWKKSSALVQNAAERAKQMRFLQSRGFSSDPMRRVVRGED